MIHHGLLLLHFFEFVVCKALIMPESSEEHLLGDTFWEA